jgi:hypothetical protein
MQKQKDFKNRLLWRVRAMDLRDYPTYPVGHLMVWTRRRATSAIHPSETQLSPKLVPIKTSLRVSLMVFSGVATREQSITSKRRSRKPKQRLLIPNPNPTQEMVLGLLSGLPFKPMIPVPLRNHPCRDFKARLNVSCSPSDKVPSAETVKIHVREREPQTSKRMKTTTSRRPRKAG